MVINQGDIFWVDLGEPIGSAPGYTHPAMVLQNNMFNHSELGTIMVCSLTSNLKRAALPGNVLLNPKEGNLPKQSVVLVSQFYTIDKSQLVEYIGTLSTKRVRQILEGLRLMTEPRQAPAKE